MREEGSPGGIPVRFETGETTCQTGDLGTTQRCTDWISRLDGNGSGDDTLAGGGFAGSENLFITAGSTSTQDRGTDQAVVAFDATNGTVAWRTSLDGGSGGEDRGLSMAVAPNDQTSAVTGVHETTTGGLDVGTSVLDAATGQIRWRASEDGPASGPDVGRDVEFGSTGERVYVTGWTASVAGSTTDAMTIAYDAGTGQRTWSSVFDGGHDRDDHGTVVAVHPNGHRVLTVGDSWTGGGTQRDVAVAAHEAASGEELWRTTFGGPFHDRPADASLSPDGDRLYVTGVTDRDATGFDLLTAAVDTTSGELIWSRHTDGGVGGPDEGIAVTVDPDGAGVYVTGAMARPSPADDRPDLAVSRLDSDTGGEVWTETYDGPGLGADVGNDVVLHPTGPCLYVVGQSQGELPDTDALTLSLDARDGHVRWTGRENNASSGEDEVLSNVVADDPSRVLGSGAGGGEGLDLLSLSYGDDCM